VSRPRLRRCHSGESGYAYLVVMGMVLLMAITSQVVLQNMLTEGRRAREDEMIWRGDQYVRAIRLYYRKTGHYPQAIDDLKSGVADLHFLRYAAYKDPLNKNGDGAWRFIYVNPAGQLLCSARYANLQQMALMDLNGGKIPVGATLGSIGVPVSSMASSPAGAAAGTTSGSPNAPNQNAGSPPSNDNPAAGNSQSSAAGQPPSSASSSSSGTSSLSESDQPVNPIALLKPTGPCDGPVIGGLLTGVGGGTESEAVGIKVVRGAKKYKEWEFIWNPLEDQARAIAAGLSGGGQPTPGGLFGVPGASNPLNQGPGSMNPGFGGAVVPPSTQPPPQN